MSLTTGSDCERWRREWMLFCRAAQRKADLVGYDDPRRALVSLTSLPTPVIVIKMGAEGALVWDKAKGTLHEAGVSRCPVVDVTGAGEAFCGGFAAGVSRAAFPWVVAPS